MITKHKEEIEKLAQELLEKETLDLLDIVSILGERPFPMTDSIKDYMKEIEIRKKDKLDKEQAEKNKAENIEEKDAKLSVETEAISVEEKAEKTSEDKEQTIQK